MRKNISFLLLILSGLVILFFINGCDSSSNTNSGSQNRESNCYQIEVPYQETEFYSQVLNYEHGSKNDTIYKGLFDVYATHSVIVKNTDTIAGTFNVTQKFKRFKDSGAKTTSLFINPGESKQTLMEFDIDNDENYQVSYSISASSKILSRQVTKYRQETRCN